MAIEVIDYIRALGTVRTGVEGRIVLKMTGRYSLTAPVIAET